MQARSAMTVGSSRMTIPSFSQVDSMSLPARATTTAVTLKLNERTGNVIENKGWLWKAWERTGNVIENKGSYANNRECC
jgi:hypothetical protein